MGFVKYLSGTEYMDLNKINFKKCLPKGRVKVLHRKKKVKTLRRRKYILKFIF